MGFTGSEVDQGELPELPPHPTGGRTWDLQQGALVVLEGIDQAGKSTQLERLKLVLPDAFFTHQPSGSTLVGSVVYQLTERERQMSPVARQFLHLASHAEHYEREIIPRLASGAVVMDRCWWSTIAYGYFAGNLQYAVPDYETFERIARLPAQGVEPAVVFVFTNAWKRDHKNTEGLIAGYSHLIERHWDVVEVVPADSVEATTRYIVSRLRDLGLLRPVQ